MPGYVLLTGLAKLAENGRGLALRSSHLLAEFGKYLRGELLIRKRSVQRASMEPPTAKAKRTAAVMLAATKALLSTLLLLQVLRLLPWLYLPKIPPGSLQFDLLIFANLIQHGHRVGVLYDSEELWRHACSGKRACSSS